MVTTWIHLRVREAVKFPPALSPASNTLGGEGRRQQGQGVWRAGVGWAWIRELREYKGQVVGRVLIREGRE